MIHKKTSIYTAAQIGGSLSFPFAGIAQVRFKGSKDLPSSQHIAPLAFGFYLFHGYYNIILYKISIAMQPYIQLVI
jgi:hypothetical protein